MNDLISRQQAIDALWKALYEYEDETEKQFQESEDLDVEDWIGHRIFVQNMNDIDRQTVLNLPSIDAVFMEKWQELKETVLELRDNGGTATQKELSEFLLNLMGVLDGEDVNAVLTGRWIGGEIGHCSCCGHHGCASDIWSGCDGDRFCPNCGARMEGKNHE